MIVEFIGLPGSGKSTIRAYVLGRMQAERGGVYSAAQYFRKYSKQNGSFVQGYSFLSIFFSYLRNFFLIVMLPWMKIFRLRSQERKIIFKLFHHNIILRDSVDRHSAGEIILFAEGMIHRACSLFIHRNVRIADGCIKRYANAVKLPTLVIYLKTNYLECLNRLKKRGWFPPRLYSGWGIEAQEILLRFQDFFDTYLDYLAKRNLKIFTVEGTDVSDVGEKVIAIIKANQDGLS